MLGSMFSAVLLSASVSAAPTDFTRPCFRNVSSDARKLLARCAKAGEVRKPVLGRTWSFVRGQFRYGCERDDFIHQWYERPLYQDSSLNDVREKDHPLNAEAWRQTVRTGREMGLDGFAFFPQNASCHDVFSRCTLPGGETPILIQLYHLDKQWDKCLEYAVRYIRSPKAWRVGGRAVIVSYRELVPDDRDSDRRLAALRRFRDALAVKFGSESFAVVPFIRMFRPNDLDRPELTAEAVDFARNRIRDFLREFDGILYTLWECDWIHPETLARTHDEIVSPIVKSVFAEPEFRNKLLGVELYEGHENPYRLFSSMPSGGMRRLRDSLLTLGKMRPDFIFGSEWDEENENVHFRPTVSNGRTTQRLWRYFAAKEAGTPPSVYPGDDDMSVPNLILSYRKDLIAGEPAEVQVTSVPDGTAKGVWQVSFRWLDPDGNCAKAFPSQRLSSEACDQISFISSSVALAANTFLRPELTVVDSSGRRQVFTDGFWPLAVDPMRSLDSKWVRQALREIPSGVTGTFSIGSRQDDGTYEVAGHVVGKRRFRSVEVLEGPNTVYMHGYDGDDAPRAGEEVVRVVFKCLDAFYRVHSPTGWISITGAPHARTCGGERVHAIKEGPQRWSLPDGRWSPRVNFLSDYGFRLPVGEVADAVVEIALPDVFGVRRVPVAELVRAGNFSFAMPYGGQVAIRRILDTPRIPRPLGSDRADFTFRLRPLDPAAVLRLQVVDEDYRIWRGPAVSLFRSSGKTQVIHIYDETIRKTCAATFDCARLYALRYDFGAVRGDLVDTMGDRPGSPCVLGGGIARVTGDGQGGCNYRHALSEANPKFDVLPGGERTAPAFVTDEDGTRALSFTGCAFATLPMQMTPRHAGFELSMRLKPTDLSGERWITDTGNVGVRLKLVDGVPEAFFLQMDELVLRGVNAVAGVTVRGPALVTGRWQELKVVYDQRLAWIEVDGRKGEVMAASGHPFNPHVPTLGCSVNATGFYRGLIAELRMRPR